MLHNIIAIAFLTLAASGYVGAIVEGRRATR